MSPRDWILIAAFLLVGAAGTYMMAAPRRLFTRAEDPAAYRPGAVEYDSAQGLWLRKTMGPGLILTAFVLILIRVI